MPEPSDLRRHKEWLGYLQPVGVVVSPAALVSKGVLVNDNVAAKHELFCGFVQRREVADERDEIAVVPDFVRCVHDVLDWDMERGFVGYAADRPVPDELKVGLVEYGETLEPTYALPVKRLVEGHPKWLLLVRIEEVDTDLDAPKAAHDRGWHASPQAKFERLLRETNVPAGLLFNGTHFRLVYAPAKESSGHLTFPVSFMSEVAGRPIFAAFLMLLEWERLVSVGDDENLPALLALSRKFQAEVSTALSEQVLAGLYELLRGLQAANARTEMKLLEDVLKRAPNQVYEGLLTVLLRLIFILYAEDRGLMPRDELYQQHYSISGLFERLREEDARYPDTMGQRYGGWAQLLSLFRLVHEGARHGPLSLPARRGFLFDPDRYPFLEGRTTPEAAIPKHLPAVPDGVVYRVLQNLLILKGERLSYRTLDVEEIGSVYERMMGFNLEVAQGPTIAIKPVKAHGAPSAINLADLLKEEPDNRAKWIRERTDQTIDGRILAPLKEARTPDEAVAALDKKVARTATPGIVPAKSMILQPSDERRRSGAHYTPRSFTAPIVALALKPVLARLSDRPTPEQILELKVCDPAMGSGAFLVEATRQLGEALVRSWHNCGQVPRVPPDEDELLYAKRVVAQRCLYGVDRNPVATDLAKLSLWLETLARDHDFTFLDHALKHGDSLVGLSKRQIEAFHWDDVAPRFQVGFEAMNAREQLTKVVGLRRRIREAGERVPNRDLRNLLDEARVELDKVRLLGDLLIAAWFGERKPNKREAKRLECATLVLKGEAECRRGWIQALRQADLPLVPFHWEIEFPEVFERENPGFDSFVGNPPFLGGRKVRETLGDEYFEWLARVHSETSGNADLVAHFFRRTFGLVRAGGTLGLIATNTIAQGDTRASGLRWICHHDGQIFAARKRVKWPGIAAVVVSVIHIMKGQFNGKRLLGDQEVTTITAFLFHRGGHDDPARLVSNESKSFVGSYVLGMGFTFDDSDSEGVATPIATMKRILARHPESREVVFPYIGGDEVNTSPTQAPHRFVIDFRDRGVEDCRRRWPDLLTIVEEKVKPERTRRDRDGAYELREPLPSRWWHHADKRPALYSAIAGENRVLVISRVGQQAAITMLPAGMVYSDSLIVFPFATYAAFCTLQSRLHETWARFFGSSLEDRLRYTPSDCFETFPLSENWESHSALEAAGKTYHEFRAALMIRNHEGLTKSYNRFHDPDEHAVDILKLRELHAAMDRAVLDAYGWKDLAPTCEFLLDYETDNTEMGDKKKPWRYRWPDDIRDEVLARLLELNAKRAKEEALTGAQAARAEAKQAKRGSRSTKRSDEGYLFGEK